MARGEGLHRTIASKQITDIHVLHQIHCQCHTLLKRQMHIIYIITIWFEKHTIRTIIIGKNHFYE